MRFALAEADKRRKDAITIVPVRLEDCDVPLLHGSHDVAARMIKEDLSFSPLNKLAGTKCSTVFAI